MSDISMGDLFRERYFRGRRSRRLRNVAFAVMLISAAGVPTWILLGATPSGIIIEVVLLPTILTVLGMVAGLSRKPQFLYPFWILLGVMLATFARVVSL